MPIRNLIYKLKTRRRRDCVTLTILTIIVLLALYASCIEPFTLRTTRWTVATPKWTNAEELKIAVLTDAHMIWPWMTPAHLQKIIDATNATQPDIVVLLGDYVGTHPFGAQLDPTTALAPLKNLKAKCGIFAVLGNHDINNGPQGWPVALKATFIPVLENRASEIECNGEKFWVAGLEEYWKQHSDIPKTLAQVTDNAPVIMLTHNPDVFVDTPQSVALTLAGHTHGGQVQIPFYGPVAAVIPSAYGNRFVYGHVNENGKDMVVSSGLGMTGLPVRFLIPPEITVVTLKGQ